MNKPKINFDKFLLAAGALFYAFRLSHDSRTVIDYTVISLLAFAMTYNLAKTGLRLYRKGGSQDCWRLSRVLCYWIVGLINTVWLSEGMAITFRPWIGGLFLCLAIYDSAVIMKKEKG
ncbi:MAG: hypothetical protein QGH51_03220 [Planctomycetota bacterium]|jgi:hypothetical protein|nr:hypothetical protein [Planctomycetota bacterium]MDP6941016.1 hypothetical protein [Planctomycetota bacterium]